MSFHGGELGFGGAAGQACSAEKAECYLVMISRSDLHVGYQRVMIYQLGKVR